jgi:acetylornithine deacetylase/succinyl-diaminopimelate desuccinylase-like protein
MKQIHEYIDANRQRYIDELCDLLRIPSISSSSAHKADVARCADALRAEMLRIGMTRAEVFTTPGHPVVYGEWLGAPGKPTVLIYGHYDVQPVDPLNLWTSPPFEPTVRDGDLYARGAVDDKGQVFAHLKAIEAYLKYAGTLPVNVKFIAEGEEEIGSVNLAGFLKEQRDLLKADAVVVSDTPMFEKGVPSICYGLRGLCYMEVKVSGPTVDLHSGVFGGGIANPANVLCEIIAKLHDTEGRVAVPHFYDRVRPLPDTERRALAALPWDEKKWLETSGCPEVVGEVGYTTLERIWARPTLDVNGIISGFTGEGAKTIIPAWASAKVSMRLVPDQRPEEIEDLFEKAVKKFAPSTVRVEVTRHHGGLPFLAPTEHAAFVACGRALEQAFGRKPVFTREGGSIPFVRDMADTLGAPCILLGFGLPDENAHAPNERFHLYNFHQGIHAVAYLMEELAR